VEIHNSPSEPPTWCDCYRNWRVWTW
jgi:hypothetical protein